MSGVQVTLEGYVFDGQVSILGIVDSVFFPGTLAFSRFEYPSSLPENVQERMAEIARRLMSGIGFDYGMFNIEISYDAESDRIHIIEINPRMSSQFADLYEKVDGTNAYEVLLDIALGQAPAVKRNHGLHATAVSFVLREFKDCLVAALPSDAELKAIRLSYPDVRIELHARRGYWLSDEMQDGYSYRYGIINLGGDHRAEVIRKFEDCRRRLKVTLLPAAASAGLVGLAPSKGMDAEV